MKRLVCTILIISLMLTLCACDFFNAGLKEPVTFYYQRTDYQYGVESGVIASEEREASGHTGDLSFLITLYLAGPLDEELVSPFPRNTQLLSVQKNQDTIRVELSDIGDRITDSQYSLACGCLTLTCLNLTESTNVTIISGERTITMNQKSLLLFDNSTAAIITEDNQ